MNEDKKPNCSSHKDLLYSEILNTSVTGHVRDLFENKQKICSTYPIQRSSVLDKVSKFLESADKADENVQNIEDVEEGQPVIDMNVTLIKETDDSENENDSELYSNDEDSDNETEDVASMTSSESDEEASENVDCSLEDKSVHKMFVANSELSQNCSKNISSKNNSKLKNLSNKALESNGQEGIPLNQQLIILSESDSEKSDSGINDENLIISSDANEEELKIEYKEVLKVNKSATSSAKSNRLLGQESETQDRQFLEFSKPDFGLVNSSISDSSHKHENSIQNLEDLRSKKRKLISVIEEDDSLNLCVTKTQKIV